MKKKTKKTAKRNKKKKTAQKTKKKQLIFYCGLHCAVHNKRLSRFSYSLIIFIICAFKVKTMIF